MIKLYQFPPAWGLPNPSPFCLKLETYLHMAKLPYQNVYVPFPQRAPKGKLPFIEDNGKRMGDSTLIIEYLKKTYGDSFDQSLRDSEKAQVHALRVMVEEHLYWCLLYYRWCPPGNWQKTKEAFFSRLPIVLRNIVPELVKKGVIKQLHGQGMGRHSATEIAEAATKDLWVLAEFLADRAFFLGNNPTSIDATMYGFLANVIWAPQESPIKEFTESQTNLIAFCERMKERYYR